jgi:ketosteroid isomerase-like protein
MNGAERAHRFFDAIQDGDRATLDRMCTPDAVVWHNYDRVDMPFETVAQGLSALRSLVKDCTYTDRQYVSIPDGAVVQHSLSGTLPDGTQLKVAMMVRIFSRDGRFCRFEEYLDPADTAPLVKAMAEATPYG